LKDLYKLESFILEKISKTKLPSLTISLIKDDEIIYMRGLDIEILRILFLQILTLYMA